MSKKLYFLISFVLVLSLASISYGSDLVGDFETDLEGWVPQTPGTIPAENITRSTNGAKLHDYSIRVETPTVGTWTWVLRCPLQADPNIIKNNNRVAFSMSMLASELAASGYGGKCEKIAIAGEGIQNGWQEAINPDNLISGTIEWSGSPNDVDFTTRLVWDYSHIDTVNVPPSPATLYLIISLYTDGTPVYYDNVLFFNSAFANEPIPANTQRNVPVDTNLAWTEGDDAVVYHDIYFGTSFAEVNDAENTDPCGPTEVYRGRQDADVNDYNIPETLGPVLTYYWRIDEVNDSGLLKRGEIWSFTTEGKAVNPTPADMATEIELAGIKLSWTPGYQTASHDVYFGTTLAEVNDAENTDPCGPTEVYRGRQDANDYNIPETLGVGTTYYWRIDEVNNALPPGLWKGNIWQFTTKRGQAKNPNPADGATGLDSLTKLSWTAGSWAATVNGHDVYLGSNFADVNTADHNDPEFKGNQSSTTYNLAGPLDFDTTYYWRIDEVNSAHPDKLWKGDVWSFTTADHRLAEDFESYASDAGLQAVWIKVNTTATVYLNTDANFAHDSNQSMKYRYRNVGTPYYSEVYANTTGPNSLPSLVGSDWSKARLLKLYFFGYVDNDPDEQPMYVKLTDGSAHTAKVPYDGDANDLLEESWHEWTIPLTAFTGVSLGNVSKIAIGFGDGVSSPTYSSYMWFDDIRLHPPICRPELAEGDIDNDCFVGLDDLETMAREWLDADVTLEVEEPNAPVLWYKFNETEGTTVVEDYGTGDHNGTAIGVEARTWDTTGGRDGNGCINLAATDGVNTGTYVDVPPAALDFAGTTNKITFAAWINCDLNNPQDNWNGLFGIRAPDEDEIVEVHCPTPLPPTDALGPRAEWSVAGNLPCQSETLTINAFAGRWNHYAFVKDADADVIQIYHNGQLLAEVRDVNAALGPMFATPVGTFYVGSRHSGWGRYIGRIDDFQVYDYALSPEEIAYIATDGTGFVPLDTPTNLYDVAPNIIDFKDFAILAKHWLEEQLWP